MLVMRAMTLRSLALAALLATAATPALADTLIDNVNGIQVDADGRIDRFSAILIGDDGRVKQVWSWGPKPRGATKVVDGGGRTLLPGLIDAHVHVVAAMANLAENGLQPSSLAAFRTAEVMHGMLMRGFTTIRDMGGPSFALKRAIDEGLLPGPRIYPSGAMITITGGHGDFRQLSDLREPLVERCRASNRSAGA